MAVEEKRLTLEEFLKLPEEKPALEFEDGVISQKVSPKGKHSALQYVLTDRINGTAWPPKIAFAYPELRVTFGGVSRVPDVAVYRWERIPADDAGLMADEFREPPDIAIEIVSPEQSVTTLVRRCLWYVARGVHIALLVDPADQSVLAFRPGQEPQAWRGPDRIDLSEVVPDFELTVEELFASLTK